MASHFSWFLLMLTMMAITNSNSCFHELIDDNPMCTLSTSSSLTMLLLHQFGDASCEVISYPPIWRHTLLIWLSCKVTLQLVVTDNHVSFCSNTLESNLFWVQFPKGWQLKNDPKIIKITCGTSSIQKKTQKFIF